MGKFFIRTEKNLDGNLFPSTKFVRRTYTSPDKLFFPSASLGQKTFFSISMYFLRPSERPCRAKCLFPSTKFVSTTGKEICLCLPSLSAKTMQSQRGKQDKKYGRLGK